MVNTRSISSLPVGSAVDAWAVIQVCRLRTASTKNAYLSWEGLDSQGLRIVGTLFSKNGLALPRIEPNTVVAVKGVLNEGRNGPGVWAESLIPVADAVDADAFRILGYPKVPPEKLDACMADLEAISGSFKDRDLLKLSSCLFAYYEPHLRILPAGKAQHEAVRGGLALHSWDVTKAAEMLCTLRPNLNRDILVFSALYHDVGKTQEYTPELTWGPNGRLVSHIQSSMQILTAVIIENSLDIPPHTLRLVKHCLASHHGKFGEVQPATREAIALHQLDYLMARLGHIDELVRSNKIGNDGWGKYDEGMEATPYVPELDDRIKQ